MKKDKQNIIIISLIVLIIGLIIYEFVFAKKEVESISLNKGVITLFPGEKEKLEVSLVPEDIDDIELIWTSENNSVASVVNGEITGISVGNTLINVQVKDSPVTNQCMVKVIPKEIENIELSDDEIELIVGNEYELKVTITPSKLQNEKLLWESSDESVATVEDGKIWGLANGEVEIKAIGGEKEAICKVKVITLVEDIKLKEEELTVEVDETKTLTPIFIPETASNKEIIWESSDPSIATVDEGIVTGNSIGNTTITATSKDGYKKATCAVTVVPKPKYTVEFTDSKKTVTIEKGSPLGNMPTPKRTNYQFLGWYTEKDGGDKVTASTVVKSNMKLYAHWKSTETYEQGPGGDIYTRTVTYMGRTFKDYKQTLINYAYSGGTVNANGCGPISLTSILSGYMNVNYKDVVHRTGLSTSFSRIGTAIEQFGLHHSGLFAYNSSDWNDAKARERARVGIENLKMGRQLIALVSGNEYCQHKSCNGHSWVAYSRGNHFIAIVGVKKDNETVIVFNPLTGKEEDSKLYDIIKYFMPGGGKGFMVVYK